MKERCEKRRECKEYYLCSKEVVALRKCIFCICTYLYLLYAFQKNSSVLLGCTTSWQEVDIYGCLLQKHSLLIQEERISTGEIRLHQILCV